MYKVKGGVYAVKIKSCHISYAYYYLVYHALHLSTRLYPAMPYTYRMEQRL